jgi:hypothetical protein
MDLKGLLARERAIWGEQKLNLGQIIVRMLVSIGDLARCERNADKDRAQFNDEEVKKELGNIIASTVRWCDDLGFDPEDCVAKALEAQEKFAKENKTR